MAKSIHRGTIVTRRLAGCALALLAAAAGCDRPNANQVTGDGVAADNCPQPSSGAGNNTGSGGESGTEGTELDLRVVDYSEALRVASLKVVGTLPTLDQIYSVANAGDAAKAVAYEDLVDQLLADDRFATRMVEHHRSTFKMFGAGLEGDDPSRETAPTFAARIVVEGRPWTDLLTASSSTCPTYAPDSGFADGECNNGIAPVGILTDPGIMGLYYGNLAFRRNRFFHEMFMCRNANAAGGAEPTTDPSTEGPCGAAAPSNYTSPWPMSSIAGECNGGRVDFHEWNTTVVCANCHATWNHRAPLWGYFDNKGAYQATFQVRVPVEGAPMAELSDWLPSGEGFAWKHGMPVASLSELGQVMASDPEVRSCAVKRMWNYAMSRGDIVDNETPVPDNVVAPLVEFFEENDFDMKATLRQILLSDDFVRF
jgi:hypothetical protein